MCFFMHYSSNTIAGSGNQHIFLSQKNKTHVGRIFYKISYPGEYHYSLLFSNVIDSTYADGSISHKNLICPPWTIMEARIAKFDKEAIPANFTDKRTANAINNEKYEFVPLLFHGSRSKEVAPGEFFNSDPVLLNFNEGDYLCLEICFSGEMMPYHEESLLPVFIKKDDGWMYNKKMPFAGMIGCDRAVQSRIGFIGDSITQGIGTKENAYSHWNALLSRKLGSQYACWNLGLGYGRANDMASDGAWAYKAKQNDMLVVCYGVNDIMQGFSEEQIIQDLTTIVSFLKKENKKVVLQTIPPFNYSGDMIKTWKNVNDYIKHTLVNKVDLVFDVVPVLQKSEQEPHMAKFGGHPNELGCELWAESLYRAIENLLI